MAKKKEPMLSKAIRGLNKTSVTTGVKPLKSRTTTAPAVYNRNKPGPKITTSAAKAAAQKAAIRKRTAARVAAAKRKR